MLSVNVSAVLNKIIKLAFVIDCYLHMLACLSFDLTVSGDEARLYADVSMLL